MCPLEKTMLTWSTSLQLRADGSGAFPIPDQPDGRPFTEPPEQLLARFAAPAHAVAQTESLAAAATASPAAQYNSHAAAEPPVAVAPLSDFLTSDPSREGPLPDEARNLVRRSRHGSGAEHSPANGGSIDRRQVDCSAVDVMPACDSQTLPASDTGTCRISCRCCHGHDKGNQGDGAHESGGSRAGVDHNGSSSMVLHESASLAGQQLCTGCGRSADSDADPWQPFRLPDAEVSARGAVMDIVTVRRHLLIEAPCQQP